MNSTTSMSNEIRIKELEQINLEEGYLIDGFPSVGFSSAIATESMIHTSQFKQAGIIDSDTFPPVSLIRDGNPNYPTRIFVNNDLKVGIFSSYLTIHESLHRSVAVAMLDWAEKHKISLIVSSVAVKIPNLGEGVLAAGSTEEVKKRLLEVGINVLSQGTIPGIPGCLLNEGMLRGQNVAVILFHSVGQGPDFKASAELCNAMSKLVPGASCNLELLQDEAEKAEKIIKETEQEARHLKDNMYG